MRDILTSYMKNYPHNLYKELFRFKLKPIVHSQYQEIWWYYDNIDHFLYLANIAE